MRKEEMIDSGGHIDIFLFDFWALFEQAGSSLNILTDRGVDRVIFGWEVPASMFQSLNAGLSSQ